MTQYDNDYFFNSYKTLRADPLSYNEVIEFPEIKKQLPEMKDKHVLDIGCGFGHLLKYFQKFHPAPLTGIDVSKRMIDECRNDPELNEARFYHGDIMEITPGVINGVTHSVTFDLIISSLTLHYVEDFPGLIEKISRWMDSNATLLFTIEHPIQTASKSKEVINKDTEGLYLRLDHYFDESIRTSYWDGTDYEVTKYHHRLDTVINSLIHSGLTIEYVKDLGDSQEALEKYDKKRIHRLQTFPPFLMVKAVKN